MPKLTRAERDEHRTWLSEWRSPNEMSDYVNRVNAVMGSADFFQQGGVEFLRDAWIAGEFGRLRSCDAVRLTPAVEQWPDFEARKLGQIERVECAETDMPERRRGAEYEKGEQRDSDNRTVGDDPYEDWVIRANTIPLALEATIHKKIAKRYPPTASLCIYLNITEWGAFRTKIEGIFSTTVRPALSHFQQIWILWGGRLYGPWSS